MNRRAAIHLGVWSMVALAGAARAQAVPADGALPGWIGTDVWPAKWGRPGSRPRQAAYGWNQARSSATPLVTFLDVLLRRSIMRTHWLLPIWLNNRREPSADQSEIELL